DGQDARLALLARVLRDPVQAAGRLVEGVPHLEDLDLVVVDGPLVLALQDVAEHRAGGPGRRAGLARPQGHLDRRRLRLPALELPGDVSPGESLHPSLVVLVMLRQGHPADRARNNRQGQQCTPHNCSFGWTRARGCRSMTRTSGRGGFVTGRPFIYRAGPWPGAAGRWRRPSGSTYPGWRPPHPGRAPGRRSSGPHAPS